MPRIQTFNVAPSVPKALASLEALAYDLTWTWHAEAKRLFRRIDPTLWESVNGNPVALLGAVGQDALNALATDDAFLAHLKRVNQEVADERAEKTWFDQHQKAAKTSDKVGSDFLVAYFCAEYGLTEALPIYSGGLGVLAGDTLKSTTATGLPYVAIGLAYQEGYFRQYLNAEGWQQEDPYDNDFTNLPIKRARRPDGSFAAVDVTIEGRTVHTRIWEVTVGRTRLFLLDTNSPQNTADDRAITYRLYGGGKEYRLKQEIVLGIGGYYALQTMGLTPTVYHMNEGHSAFMGLARIRELVEQKGLTFGQAREACAANNVFTTHTPVPAGFDIFELPLIDRFLPHMHEVLGIDRQSFYLLGAHEDDPMVSRGFNMAYLALRCSGRVNGVSQLHAEVSREMWRRLWPGWETREVPILGITNGIHINTWTGVEMSELLERYLGHSWQSDPASDASWEAVDRIPDAELWRTHERGRERLVSFVRDRAVKQATRLSLPRTHVAAAAEVLDPQALTIGFARRFATYKRATLLLREPERLRRLLTDPARPVQFIFAGKAHPKDEPAKELIKALVQFGRDPEIRRRIVFVEEYDMGVARKLVQGVDVWLNNPRRPKEASGTSGMKVLSNGGLNLSVLDGWWAEAYDGVNGWAIGAGELYDPPEEGDAIEARLLLDLLEEQVIPMFYGRGPDGLPSAWIARMKHSMKGISGFFSTDRMIQEYATKLYFPASQEGRAVVAKGYAGAKALADQAARLSAGWPAVKIGEVTIGADYDLTIGQPVTVEAPVFLGDVVADDVSVEIVGGLLDGNRVVQDAEIVAMTTAGAARDGWHTYKGEWTPATTGHNGCTIRVRPSFDRAAPARELAVKFWE